MSQFLWVRNTKIVKNTRNSGLGSLIRLYHSISQGCIHLKAYLGWRICFQDGSLTWSWVLAELNSTLCHVLIKHYNAMVWPSRASNPRKSEKDATISFLNWPQNSSTIISVISHWLHWSTKFAMEGITKDQKYRK